MWLTVTIIIFVNEYISMLISKGGKEGPQHPAPNLNFKSVSKSKGCFQKAVNPIPNLRNA